MKRTYWKKNYIDIKLYEEKKFDWNIKISRNSTIVSNFIGKTFEIYNGKKFIRVQVWKEMLGHKFGEFHFTRVSHTFKKK